MLYKLWQIAPFQPSLRTSNSRRIAGRRPARRVSDRSHPLSTIEMAVNSLSGLPNSFTSRISDFATEFEVEYTVLGAVDDGLTDVEKIRDRVLLNVRRLSTSQSQMSDTTVILHGFTVTLQSCGFDGLFG